MKNYIITTASLILLAAALPVTAGEGSGDPGSGYVPEPVREPFGLEHPAHNHPMPPAYPVSGAYPYAYAPAPRIHLEKAMYEEGYLLRVHTRGITPEDIEVVADRGRLRLRSERSRQREWQSDEPYRRSSLSSRSSVRRSARLPYDADVSKLTTRIEDGVLEIRIPRL